MYSLIFIYFCLYFGTNLKTGTLLIIPEQTRGTCVAFVLRKCDNVELRTLSHFLPQAIKKPFARLGKWIQLSTTHEQNQRITLP